MTQRLSFVTLINRLKLRHLQFLVQVDEERNLTAVGTRTGISQPAATKLLRDIEALLGHQLFERSRHKLAPTEAGDLVLAAARRMLSEVRRLGEELHALKDGASGRVSIGSLISASSTLLPFSLGRLSRERPNVTASILEATEDILLPALLLGELDCVLGRLPEHADPRFEMRELYRERFVIVARAGHPIVQTGSDTTEALRAASWVLPPPLTNTRRGVEQTLIRSGLGAPRIVAESGSVMVNLRLVQASDSLTVIPLTMARLHAAAGTLVPVEAGPDFAETKIGIVTCADRVLTPAARLFVEAVEDVARQLDAGTMPDAELVPA